MDGSVLSQDRNLILRATRLCNVFRTVRTRWCENFQYSNKLSGIYSKRNNTRNLVSIVDQRPRDMIADDGN